MKTAKISRNKLKFNNNIFDSMPLMPPNDWQKKCLKKIFYPMLYSINKTMSFQLVVIVPVAE